jgi:hypothetical protein
VVIIVAEISFDYKRTGKSNGPFLLQSRIFFPVVTFLKPIFKLVICCVHLTFLYVQA